VTLCGQCIEGVPRPLIIVATQVVPIFPTRGRIRSQKFANRARVSWIGRKRPHGRQQFPPVPRKWPRP